MNHENEKIRFCKIPNRGFVAFFGRSKSCRKVSFSRLFRSCSSDKSEQKTVFFGNWGSVSALPVLRFRGVDRFRAWFRNRETLRFCGYCVWAVASFVGKTWPRKVCEKFWSRNEKCSILFREACLGPFLARGGFSCGAERVFGPLGGAENATSDLLTRSQVPIVLSFSLRRRAFAGSQFHSRCGLARSSSDIWPRVAFSLRNRALWRRNSACGCGFAGFCTDISQHVASVSSSALKLLETAEMGVFGSSGWYP